MYTLVYQNNKKYQAQCISESVICLLYVSTLHAPYIEQSLVLKKFEYFP